MGRGGGWGLEIAKGIERSDFWQIRNGSPDPMRHAKIYICPSVLKIWVCGQQISNHKISYNILYLQSLLKCFGLECLSATTVWSRVAGVPHKWGTCPPVYYGSQHTQYLLHWTLSLLCHPGCMTSDLEEEELRGWVAELVIKSHHYTEGQVKWLSGLQKAEEGPRGEKHTCPPWSRNRTCHSRCQPQKQKELDSALLPSHLADSFLTFNLTEGNPKKGPCRALWGMCAALGQSKSSFQNYSGGSTKDLESTLDHPGIPSRSVESHTFSVFASLQDNTRGQRSVSFPQARHPQGTGPVGQLRTQFQRPAGLQDKPPS